MPVCFISPLLSSLGLLLLLLFTQVSSAFAQIDIKFPDGTKYVKTEIVSQLRSPESKSSNQEQAPTLEVGVHFTIEPGWHIYWMNPGEAATPTRVEWTLPEVLKKTPASKLQWPTPHRFVERGDIITFGYENEVLLSQHFQLTESAKQNEQKDNILKAEVSWLVCKDICVPGRSKLEHKVTLLKNNTRVERLFDKFRWQIPLLSSEQTVLPGLSAKEQLSLNREEVSPGEKFVATVFLPGFRVSSSEEAGELLQLFPHPSSVFDFDRPYVARLADEAGEPGGVIVNIPVSTASDASEGKHPLSFTLALRSPSEDRSSMREVVSSVSVQTEASTEVQENDLAEYAMEFVPLIYRTVTHEKTSSLPPEVSKEASLSSLALLMAMLSAFIGGLLLNLMPCVLPILSLKVMGCISARDKATSESRRAAFAYSVGIIASFLALAACVVLLKSMGISVGWGFQFQHPEFVAALAFVVFLLALGFFDFYSVQLPGMQSANKIVGNLHPSAAKHFFDGVLATALSTPCTAPFLGSALIVAFSQPASITFLLFFCVGLGLALPYSILITSPKLLCYLPKPGEWMCRVRHIMGFFLLLTVLWLLFVLHQLTKEGVIWSLAGMLSIYFTFWLIDWTNSVANSSTRKCLKVSALCLCIFSLLRFSPGITSPASGSREPEQASGVIKWQAYSEENIQQAQDAGQAVFIDFTADWCVTCKANEFLVIETASVAQSIEKQGILPIKADWTTGDPEITTAIKRYGGEGVPLYVLLPGDPSAPPVVFPSLLTASRLINAFEQVSISRN